MNVIEQTVTLRSDKHFGRRVPPEALGEVLRLLPEAIQQSVRMVFEGRSTARGRRPNWLESIADIRFIEHTGDDETVLHFEAPQLGDAAPTLFEQTELWPNRPSETDTAFDLLCDVLKDVAESNRDSERFDLGLVRQIAEFRKGLNGTFQEMNVTGVRFGPDTPGVVNSDVIEAARSMSRSTPKAKRVRVCGRLDMLRESTQAFAIRLPDDAEVRGVLTEGAITSLAGLFARDVLVTGTAVFRPSGRLLRIDADDVSTASERDRYFARVPEGKPSVLDVAQIVREQRAKRGVAGIFGKWPGDETDEQVEQALAEIS